ncbi:MAG: hypothetical protein GWN10_21870, partial [Nitrospinaceae bacterium]|nr:hypothetical protein [Nitrospinaceae bacterium]NIT84414.1 hypothetical protein [Nitrospinaceae bacterium]NIW08155.1 hypothetical protein [Nitrospinaceae bacterium]NIX36758.1 hypothetical protein [Nitrospinaceae bacterium]
MPAEPEQFFHIHPFGHKEENAAGGPLFPPLPNEGELYIGIKNLAPPQKLSMLFHTLEGSSNPLKKENTLQWHFLQGNEWVEV